jgi:hypothetical protein
MSVWACLSDVVGSFTDRARDVDHVSVSAMEDE